MKSTMPPPEAYLVIFYIVMLGCAACVLYGGFLLVRRAIGRREGQAEAQVEFDKLRARLAAENPTVLGIAPEPFAASAPSTPSEVLQGQELLQTDEGRQAQALLRVAGIVSMTDRFWVRQDGNVFVFTKSPDGERAPAWLVRVDTEKVEAVPAGVSIDSAVTRMNSANSQSK